MSKRPWSTVELDVLRIAYPHTTTAIIATVLKRSMRSVFAQAYSLGLKKSAHFLASPLANRTDGNRGGATRFKPGHKTWNKGMKGLNLGGKATQFKPGVRQGVAVELYKPIGTERVSKDGYLQRKVNDGMPLQRRWKCVHVIVWEEANGPVPPKHHVAFRDGDKTHIALDNLELVSFAEMCRRNSIHRLSPELKEVSQLRGQIRATITKRLKKEARHGREQAHQ